MSEKEKMPINKEEEENKKKNNSAHLMSDDELQEFEEDLAFTEHYQGHEQDLEELKKLRKTIVEEDGKEEKDNTEEKE